MGSAFTSFSWTGKHLQMGDGNLITPDARSVSILREKLPTEDGEVPAGTRDADYLGMRAAGVIKGIAAEIRSRLDEGPGMAILSGGGLAELTDCQLRHAMLAISVTLGSPMAQNPAGDLIVSVRDEAPQDPLARGYRTKEHLPMHTDAADFAGLVCLQQGASGGGNSFVSAATVHDTLCDEEPDLVPEFYRRWEWDRRGLEPPGEPPTLTSSIFSYYRGYLSCRYASKLLRKGPTRLGQQLSPAQARALDCFEEVAARPDLKVSWCLRRGESVWLNNYAVLHAREAFTNGAESAGARHLLRTWIWAREGRPLAPAFASPREAY